MINYKTYMYIIFSLLISSFSFPATIGQSDKVYIYKPDEKPYGKTFEEYAQMHWQTHVNLNSSQSPAFESYKPQKCQLFEVDNKIFLQDFYAESQEFRQNRAFECTIPQLPVIIPALTEGCSYGDYPDLADRNDGKLRECADSHNPQAIVQVTIDGHPVNNIDEYLIKSNKAHFFTLNVTNKENAYQIASGNWRAMISASIIVVDLPVGEHSIEYKVWQDVTDLYKPRDFPLLTSVKYYLTVEPRHNDV
jgi:hypothetical protein